MIPELFVKSRAKVEEPAAEESKDKADA